VKFVNPLFVALVEREFKNRFLGGVLSPIWWVVQPLLQLSVYALVFGMFLKVQLPEKYGTSYLAFLAVGLWPWLAFTESVTRGAGSLLQQGALITKTPLPRAWVPLATVCVSFALHFVALCIIVLLLKAFGIAMNGWGILASVPTWIALFLTALGAAWFVSVAQVLIRDVEPMLGPILFLMTFLAPIQYALTIVPETFRPYVYANPFTHAIERMHEVFLTGPVMPTLIDLLLVLGGALVAVVGYAVFKRVAPHVDDYL
jgi:lipopolysaccharide transport system permease protein